MTLPEYMCMYVAVHLICNTVVQWEVLTRSVKLFFHFLSQPLTSSQPTPSKAILHFVNQSLSSLGLHIDDVDQQVEDDSTSGGLCRRLITSCCVFSTPVC